MIRTENVVKTFEGSDEYQGRDAQIVKYLFTL